MDTYLPLTIHPRLSFKKHAIWEGGWLLCCQNNLVCIFLPFSPLPSAFSIYPEPVLNFFPLEDHIYIYKTVADFWDL